MWICPNCQTQNEGNFCSSCGTPFTPPVQETAPVAPEKKNRGILVACLVVSAIGLILIILLLVLLLGKDDFNPTGLQTLERPSATATAQATEMPANSARFSWDNSFFALSTLRLCARFFLISCSIEKL